MLAIESAGDKLHGGVRVPDSFLVALVVATTLAPAAHAQLNGPLAAWGVKSIPVPANDVANDYHAGFTYGASDVAGWFTIK